MNRENRLAKIAAAWGLDTLPVHDAPEKVLRQLWHLCTLEEWEELKRLYPIQCSEIEQQEA